MVWFKNVNACDELYELDSLLFIIIKHIKVLKKNKKKLIKNNKKNLKDK